MNGSKFLGQIIRGGIFKKDLMEPNEFVAEVYRRMSLRLREQKNLSIEWDDFLNNRTAVAAAGQYELVLPRNKNARILDIGFGQGWFMSACIRLGYTNIYGADFNAEEKMLHVCKATSSIQGIYNLQTNIGDFLANKNEKYDFIHLSHVIEHIPKYSLLYVTDALYRSLFKDGVLFLRYLFGLRSPSLVTGAMGAGATRTASEIESYIKSTMP